MPITINIKELTNLIIKTSIICNTDCDYIFWNIIKTIHMQEYYKEIKNLVWVELWEMRDTLPFAIENPY